MNEDQMRGFMFDPQPWADDALCAQTDPEAFFPEWEAKSSAAARRICNGDGERPPCPVRAECLAYALDNDEAFGVWGGTTAYARRSMRSRTKREGDAA